MRILSVAHAFPRRDGDVAGAFIERLVRALAARGHAMTVLVPADTGAGGIVERHDYTLNRIRYAPARWETLAYRGTMATAHRSVTGVGLFASLVIGMMRMILVESKRQPIDLVHAHWWLPAGLAAWLAHRRGGPAYVVTLHGTDVAVMNKSRLARPVARRVLRRASGITAVSRYLAETAASVWGEPAERITVQAMPVEVGRHTRASGGGGGVVTVGRLVPQKRIDLLIDAIAVLRAGGRGVTLTVIGDGPERTKLEQRARAAGILAMTRFVGSVEPDRVPELLQDADVLVFPAKAEGFGLAVVEALMAGVPVIAASDGGGAVEAVPDVAGMIVDVTNADALAQAIAATIDNPSSRRAAAGVGQALKRDLLPAQVAKVFESVYQTAMAASR